MLTINQFIPVYAVGKAEISSQSKPRPPARRALRGAGKPALLGNRSNYYGNLSGARRLGRQLN